LYPRAVDAVRKYLIDKMVESSDENVPEQFRNDIKERVDDILSSIIENSPRALFDLFDRNKIFIGIDIGRGGSKDVIFRYRILLGNGDNGAHNKRKFDYMSEDRKETEEIAIKYAFSVLERKLKRQENDRSKEEQT